MVKKLPANNNRKKKSAVSEVALDKMLTIPRDFSEWMYGMESLQAGQIYQELCGFKHFWLGFGIRARTNLQNVKHSLLPKVYRMYRRLPTSVPDNHLMLGIWLTHRLGSMATMEWVKSPRLTLTGRVYLLEYTLVCVKQVPLITISGRNEKAYRWSPTKIGVATFRRKGTLPWTW